MRAIYITRQKIGYEVTLRTLKGREYKVNVYSPQSGKWCGDAWDTATNEKARSPMIQNLAQRLALSALLR